MTLFFLVFYLNLILYTFFFFFVMLEKLFKKIFSIEYLGWNFWVYFWKYLYSALTSTDKIARYRILGPKINPPLIFDDINWLICF